jgi:hypothetical protein
MPPVVTPGKSLCAGCLCTEPRDWPGVGVVLGEGDRDGSSQSLSGGVAAAHVQLYWSFDRPRNEVKAADRTQQRGVTVRGCHAGWHMGRILFGLGTAFWFQLRVQGPMAGSFHG